jgi:RNA polymerase sigma factor (sigma-70 family)
VPLVHLHTCTVLDDHDAASTLPHLARGDRTMHQVVSFNRGGDKGAQVREHDQSVRFEQLILPHLDVAYNLARWLIHNDQDAQDLVQEACLRAFRSFHSFRGGDSRIWLLTIVRNTCYSWLRQRRADDALIPFQEELHDVGSEALDPEALHIQRINQQRLRDAIEALPVEFREVLILRELEDLSYKEISVIANVPLGTVMSRLARARKWLQRYLAAHQNEEG